MWPEAGEGGDSGFNLLQRGDSQDEGGEDWEPRHGSADARPVRIQHAGCPGP